MGWGGEVSKRDGSRSFWKKSMKLDSMSSDFKFYFLLLYHNSLLVVSSLHTVL